MVNATSIVEISTQLFVDVPGVVIGGWVGFGIFIALFLATLVLTWFQWIRDRHHIYQLLLYCGLMVIAYLLAATEQFVLERDKDDDVSLLMVIVNAFAWMWGVILTGGYTQINIHPLKEKYSKWIACISQICFFISAFVWNGTVYALWAFALVLMIVSIMHYGYDIINGWNGTTPFTRVWLWWAIVYTVAYVFAAFLSHLYLAVLSLSAAVWVFLVLHLAVFFWLLYVSRQISVNDLTFQRNASKVKAADDLVVSYNPALAAAQTP